jgi:catechol 2,3-dioxygenase-like lactoylglutathione lyase family enzyme
MSGIDAAVPDDLREALGLPDASQVALVVRNLDDAVAHLEGIVGLGPFVRPEIHYDPIYYRGEPSPGSSWEMAFCSLGPIELEVVMPVTRPTIYHDFLDTVGEGLHHIGFDLPDLDARLELCDRLGIRILQMGRTPAGGFAYLDTVGSGGLMVELIQRKARRA